MTRSPRPTPPAPPALLSSSTGVGDAIALRTGGWRTHDPRTVNIVGDERNGDVASDAGTAFVGTAFVGTDAAAAKLDALLTRPGDGERVREIRAQMAAAAADVADVDPR